MPNNYKDDEISSEIYQVKEPLELMLRKIP